MSKYVDGINEHNMDMFLKALRSGEYGQTKGILHRVSPEGKVGFCCLGVMSNLACQNGVGDMRVKPDGEGGHTVDYSGHWGLPTSEVLDWIGIPQANRKDALSEGVFNIQFPKSGIVKYGETATASLLNDYFGKTFGEIADIFENEFKAEKETV